jgi:hypothetical protein
VNIQFTYIKNGSSVLVDSTTQGIPTGTFLEIGDLECRFFRKKIIPKVTTLLQKP